MADKPQPAEATTVHPLDPEGATQPSHVTRRALFPSGVKLADGRLEITRRIGEGGMGVVYEAFDFGRRSKVALKTLSRMDAAGIYELKNEFRALADVSHPNLVRLYELFAEGEQWFFTMDLVDGERFDSWVRPDGALHEARLRSALPQLSSAVMAIHAAGKLHRDLKPSNVLVTPEGRVVVLDFGLATEPEIAGPGHTLGDSSVSGTPAYMAPEQAAGKTGSAASDFYALGVMLFEALTGKLPFEGRPFEMLAAKQSRAAPSAAEACATAPADLAALCTELLATEPSERLGASGLCARLGISADARVPTTVRVSHAPHAIPELVGRYPELTALRAAYEASTEGHKPVIVLLSGESGIGKSALVERFLAELRSEGHAVVLSGRCYERESVPFKGFDVLIDELSRYLRKQSAIDTASMMPRAVYALRRLFPVLGRVDLIALAPERSVPDAFELRRRGFLALGELLARIRDRQPLVVAIDDLQWSDRDSTTLLLHLVRQPDAPRMLLIASHRSEGMQQSPVLEPLYALELDMRLDVRRIGVGPLSIDAATALVGDRLGDGAEALVREAAGNPFLLGELSRAGRAAAGRSLAQIVRDRVAGLPEAERALLEVMAIAARPLALELAAKAAGVAEHASAAFDALRAAQLARSAVHQGSVECYHDRVRESVAAGLQADVVRARHLALGHALVQTPDADPEHLSEHFEQAGESMLAAEYAVRAADRAMRAFAFDQAARLYGKALRSGAFDAREARRLQVALGDALAHCGRGPAAAEAYLRAADGAPEAEALELKSRAGEQYLVSGRLGRGRELTAETLRPFGMRLPGSVASAVATLALERSRLWMRGLALKPSGHGSETPERLAALQRPVPGLGRTDGLSCAALNTQVLRRALDAGNARVAVQGLHYEIWSRSLGIGDPAQVPELARHARTLLDELEAPDLEAYQEFFLGLHDYVATPDGDLDRALERIERFVAFAHAEPQLISVHDRSLAQFHQSNLLAVLGRSREVARELPALLDEAWQRSDLFLIPMFMCTPFVAWLAVGGEAEAERELARAQQAWSALDNPYAYQDFLLHEAQLWLRHHRGDARGAWQACQAHDGRFRASFASRSIFFACYVQFLRGCAAANLAAQCSDAAERKMLLQEADREPLPLRRSSHWKRLLLLPRAAAACARGDRQRGLQLLREFDAGPRPAAFGPIYAHAVRRRIGVLLGGDEGSKLVADADAFLRAGGAADPQRIVAMLVPGCEVR